MARTALNFRRARTTLDDLIARSAGAGRIPFDQVNTFVEEDLFQLKEACHALFRSEDNSHEVDVSAAGLFDILVGSLFHQMMMVKENTYQIEAYTPKYAALRRAVRGADPPEHGESFLREGERLIKRASRALRHDLSHVVELFSEAVVVLRQVLTENRGNPLLVRMLVANKEVIEAVYGPRRLEEILSQMFDGRPAAAYLVAAGDFLEGGWYDRARECCQRARVLEPSNERAAELLNKINTAARAHLKDPAPAHKQARQRVTE